MRTKKHYEDMLSKSPNTTIGFTLAADMVYAARHDIINRADAHGGDEWKNIARNLKSRYGENLTVDEVRHEMSPVKAAATAMGSAKSERKAAEGAEIVKEIMEAYHKYRDLWMLKRGTSEGFDDWFRAATQAEVVK